MALRLCHECGPQVSDRPAANTVRSGNDQRLEILRKLVASYVLLLLVVAPGTAQESADLLVGMDGLAIATDVPDVDPGLTDSFLRQYAELRLKQARVPILTLEDPNDPIVFLNVNAVRTAAAGWAYAVDVSVYRWSCVVDFPWEEGGPSGCARMPVWSRGLIRLTPSDLSTDVRDELEGMMDRLLNDYLSANPN